CKIKLQISFFFQAEDGIRDFHVTGVQTCALPIFRAAQSERSPRSRSTRSAASVPLGSLPCTLPATHRIGTPRSVICFASASGVQIGRASCRERVWIVVVTSGFIDEFTFTIALRTF